MKEVYGKPINGYKFADLHVHTTASEDVGKHNMGMRPWEAVLSAEATGLSAIAITDHNILSSSYDAIEFAQREGLQVEVIPGMEIATNEGHLIALGISSPIESRLSLNESIRLIHEQNGLAIAPHPFFIRIGSIGVLQLENIAQSEDPAVYLDGFETYSAGITDLRRKRPHFADTNARAQELYVNKTYDLGASIGSSDTHRMTVGRGVTAYKGSLFDAITRRTTMAVMLEEADSQRLVLEAIRLFGQERVLGNVSLEEFKSRYSDSQ